VVNNAATVHALLALGADGIVTDRVDLAAPIVARARGSPVVAAPPVHPGPARLAGAAAGRYHIPAASPEEVHTCASLLCRVAQVLATQPWLVPLWIVLGVIVVRKYIALMRQMCRRSARAPAAGVAAGVPVQSVATGPQQSAAVRKRK
jgi:hypothetical protein